MKRAGLQASASGRRTGQTTTPEARAKRSSTCSGNSLLHVVPCLALGNVVESLGMHQLATIQHHAQKSRTAGDPVRHAAWNVRHLAGIELERSPFRMVQRVTAKLKPDLVLIAAAVKAVLFLFKIVNIDPELLAVVQHRSAGTAFARHAGEIIERAEFPDDPAAFALATNQCR